MKMCVFVSRFVCECVGVSVYVDVYVGVAVCVYAYAFGCVLSLSCVCVCVVVCGVVCVPDFTIISYIFAWQSGHVRFSTCFVQLCCSCVAAVNTQYPPSHGLALTIYAYDYLNTLDGPWRGSGWRAKQMQIEATNKHCL